MAIWWRDWVAAPIFNLFSSASAHVPFSIAEWALPALPCMLFMLFTLRHRRAARALLCLCLAPLLLWGSLYFCAADAPSAPDPAMLQNLCESLIDHLNARPLHFSESMGDDPRVKTANFPFWMRRLHISGIFIPWSGEILISPDADSAALPFIIAHEKMHLRGIADEGEANIAAWRACHSIGGEAADSADLWALGYALRMLKRAAPAAYAAMQARLQPHLRRALRFFDTNAAPSTYENLSAYLAANPAGWYNEPIPTMENAIS